MSANTLVFLFGAISSGSLGLVFLIKWVLDGKHEYDLAWAGSTLSLAIGALCVSAQLSYASDVAGIAANLLFWSFAVLIILGNLTFVGKEHRTFRIVALGVALAFASIVSGVYHYQDKFVPAVAALLYFWTGWILHGLPIVGRLILVLFVARGVLVASRPVFAATPHIIEYSLATFSVNFLAGAALLAGSLLRSRDRLRASEQGLREANAELLVQERELRQSNRMLESQAVRMERLTADYALALQRAEHANQAKDSFISNMNHEFRTPLNAVLGFSELAVAEAGRHGNGKIGEYLAGVQEGGRAMLRNVNRILEFVSVDSAAQPARHERFDPAAAMRAEVDALRKLAGEKRLTLSLATDGAPTQWEADAYAFRSIARELLDNAVKAAPPGSEVRVSLQGNSEDVTLRIIDTGAGLSDAFLRTVGDRFNISEPVLTRGGVVQGVGLGLCIADRYARLLGGRLVFERNVPSGTVVSVTLPAEAAARKPASAANGLDT